MLTINALEGNTWAYIQRILSCEIMDLASGCLKGEKQRNFYLRD